MLVRSGLTPNQVSGISVGVALLGFASYLGVACPDATIGLKIALLIAAAACVQLRLLCNMMDGMMAVEGGLKSKTGDMFNEIPDRFADVLFLVGAGYAVMASGFMIWGWLAALLAVMTAYLRAFGASLGLPHDFSGPMAKPHRMFTLTVASLVAAGQLAFGREPGVLGWGLIIICGGAVITCYRRTRHIATALKSR